MLPDVVRRATRTPAPRISVIVPTGNRSTLRRTIRSCRWADEVIVVFDASLPPWSPRGCVVLAEGPTRNWGNAQRNRGIASATGTHLAFMDDDDVYTWRAGARIRAAVSASPERVHVFGMRHRDSVMPARAVEVEQIGTPMFVVPAHPVGSWTTRYAADFDFITETLRLRGDVPVFHEHVIASIRPRTLRYVLGETRRRIPLLRRRRERSSASE
jgi:glycosyltransferase involved in cell wall biosynthesis